MVPGTYHLQRPYGTDMGNPWNIEHLHRFYPLKHRKCKAMYPSTHSIKSVAFYTSYSTYSHSLPSRYQHARRLCLGHQPAPARISTSRTRTTWPALNEHSRVRPGATLCHPNSSRILMISSQAPSRAQSLPLPTRQIQKRTRTVGIN